MISGDKKMMYKWMNIAFPNRNKANDFSIFFRYKNSLTIGGVLIVFQFEFIGIFPIKSLLAY